jgi:pseudoazurin
MSQSDPMLAPIRNSQASPNFKDKRRDGDDRQKAKRTDAMKTLILATLVSLTAMPAIAADSVVEMLNSKDGENFVFSEKFTKIAKGDTITFKATKPGHNAEFVPGGFPQGAAELHGQIGKDVAYTFSTPGIYLVRCAPHFGMGMVAVVEVDAPSNLDQIKQLSLPGKVRTVVDEQLKKG